MHLQLKFTRGTGTENKCRPFQPSLSKDSLDFSELNGNDLKLLLVTDRHYLEHVVACFGERKPDVDEI